MKLRAGAFHLELSPLCAVDEEDWVQVQVEVQAAAFRGSFGASLQLNDLVRFAADLRIMYERLGQMSTAVLSSAEPDVQLRLESHRLGGVSGNYRLECERIEGTPTQLSGAVQLDQSCLPELASSVEGLVHALSGSRA